MGIILITATIIMLASLSGLIFLIKGFSGWLSTNSKYIIAFSSGIFAVVTYDLLIETFESSGSWIYTLALVALGFLVFTVAERLFPEIHHHDEDKENCAHAKHKVIWGDALHNIGDGILLATSFAVDIKVGLIAAFGIFIHEFVQEMGEFSVLKLSGMSTRRALLVNLLVATTIFAGVFLGLTFADSPVVATIMFGLSAGVFLHLVSTDLIPQSIKHSKKDRRKILYLLLVVAGALTIAGVNSFGGHDDIHGGEKDNHPNPHDIVGNGPGNLLNHELLQ